MNTRLRNVRRILHGVSCLLAVSIFFIVSQEQVSIVSLVGRNLQWVGRIMIGILVGSLCLFFTLKPIDHLFPVSNLGVHAARRPYLITLQGYFSLVCFWLFVVIFLYSIIRSPIGTCSILIIGFVAILIMSSSVGRSIHLVLQVTSCIVVAGEAVFSENTRVFPSDTSSHVQLHISEVIISTVLLVLLYTFQLLIMFTVIDVWFAVKERISVPFGKLIDITLTSSFVFIPDILVAFFMTKSLFFCIEILSIWICISLTIVVGIPLRQRRINKE